MKRVGILIDRLNVGGVEKIAIQEVRELRRNGIEAYLLVLKRKGVVDNAYADLRIGVPTIFLDDRLPSVLKLSFKFPIFNFFSLFHLTYPFYIPFILKRNEFDYIIVHNTYTAFSAVTIKLFRGIHYSIFVWDPISYVLSLAYAKSLKKYLKIFLKIAVLLDKLIFYYSDIILTGGSSHNNYIHSLAPSKKIVVIPPAVESIDELPLHKDNYILMVTGWRRGKEPEYVFDIIKRLPKLKIIMVGKWLSDSYKKEFNDKLHKYRFQKNITVVGEVNESQLATYYSKALVLLETCVEKGFGMPPMEASGHGTTFIIPDVQGVCSLFKDKIHGYFTKEKDTDSIVNYLDTFIHNKALAINMGKRAWELTRRSYSWKNHVNTLMDVIGKNIN